MVLSKHNVYEMIESNKVVQRNNIYKVIESDESSSPSPINAINLDSFNPNANGPIGFETIENNGIEVIQHVVLPKHNIYEEIKRNSPDNKKVRFDDEVEVHIMETAPVTRQFYFKLQIS